MTHIRSQEYYHELRRSLKPEGAVVIIGIHDHNLAVFAALLKSFRYVYRLPWSNISIVASDHADPIRRDRLEKILQAQQSRLGLPEHIDMDEVLSRLERITPQQVESIQPIRDVLLTAEYRYRLF